MIVGVRHAPVRETMRAGIMFTSSFVSYMLFPRLLDCDPSTASELFDTIFQKSRLADVEVPCRESGFYGPALAQRLRGRTSLVGLQTKSLQEHWSLCAPDPDERAHGRECLNVAIATAVELSARFVGVWAGEYRGDRPSHLRDLAEALEPATKQAADGGVRIVLEPFPRCSSSDSLISTADEGLGFIKDYCPDLSLMYDPAHEILEDIDRPSRSVLSSMPRVGFLQLGTGWRNEDGERADRHPRFDDRNAMHSWNDMSDILGIMATQGYRGPASFEIKARSDDPFADLEYINELVVHSPALTTAATAKEP